MQGPALKRHASGLRTQALTGPALRHHEEHTVALPVCCPVSLNPAEGSTLRLSYVPEGWVIDVLSFPALLRRFVGGWPGSEEHPAIRDMEGMIGTLVQMAADATGVRVNGRADIVLTNGQRMRLRFRAGPR